MRQLLVAAALLFSATAHGALRYVGQVDTPAALVAANPLSLGDVVAVKSISGTATDDGGLYYYDSDDTTATNTTTVFAPSSGTGRWLRMVTSGAAGSGDDLLPLGNTWTGTNTFPLFLMPYQSAWPTSLPANTGLLYASTADNKLYWLTQGGTTYDITADSTSLVESLESQLDSLSYTVSELDAVTAKLGETNTIEIAFTSLNIRGQVERKQRFTTGATQTPDWDSDVDVFHFVNEPVTVADTGTPKLGQTLALKYYNTNAVNYEITFDGLPWVWQKTVNTVRSNSWIEVFVTYTSTNGVDYYTADASAPVATTTVGEGGSGRTTHPQNYLLVGDVTNPFKAASIGSGLELTGTGQAMTLSVVDAEESSGELEITTVEAGANVYTNSTQIAVDTSLRVSADVLFSGQTNSVDFLTRAVMRYEDGEAITIATNQLITPAGTALWAGWIAGHTDNRYPVLRVGGLDGEDGVLEIFNIRTRSLSLVEASTPATTYIIDEDFEDTGAPASWSTIAGTVDYDYDADSDGNEWLRMEDGTTCSVQTPSFTAVDGLLLKYITRLENDPGAYGGYVVELKVGSGDAPHAYVTMGSDRRMGAVSGGTSWTSASIGTLTDYYFWVRFKRNTGGNNGIISVAWATTDTEPTSGNQYVERTGLSNANQVGIIRLRGFTQADLIWDDVQVTEWAGP